MKFNKEGMPEQSSIYLVDRGLQGKWYRYYDVDTEQWGLACPDLDEAFYKREIKSNIGFFPWFGPLTGPNYIPGLKVTDDTTTKKLITKTDENLSVAVVTNVPVVKVANEQKKVIKRKKLKGFHADGTIFFRSDRNMWVAVMNNKQEAARETAEKCLKFLQKKYNLVGTVLAKE